MRTSCKVWGNKRGMSPQLFPMHGSIRVHHLPPPSYMIRLNPRADDCNTDLGSVYAGANKWGEIPRPRKFYIAARESLQPMTAISPCLASKVFLFRERVRVYRALSSHRGGFQISTESPRVPQLACSGRIDRCGGVSKEHSRASWPHKKAVAKSNQAGVVPFALYYKPVNTINAPVVSNSTSKEASLTYPLTFFMMALLRFRIETF
ncbi:hypothetical protein DL93DRAFT_742224 [Clavulina sp. PMI_390]|nr:hypothetical protein DL93DRAFT_742224 [Clavulina sp. PMI_390]